MNGIPVMLMRGGTSKGAYFLAEDLPADQAERDELLLAIMGSPDPRQIDGIGGAHPLTSKVAVIGRSGSDNGEIDYLFLQVQVDKPIVSAEQPCGNILAGVGPFAIARGLVTPESPTTSVPVRMVNTGALAIAHVPTPAEKGATARILLEFQETAGSVAPALLPTGNVVDEIDGIPTTLIDNGMPVAIVEAACLGASGNETPAELESQTLLRQRIEALRREAGRRMSLGDVTTKTVPKVCLVAPPSQGGSLTTRMFIPHRVHTAIGVLAAVTVATAAAMPGSVAAGVAQKPADPLVPNDVLRLEHPTGHFDTVTGEATAIVSSARLLMEGMVFPGPAKGKS